MGEKFRSRSLKFPGLISGCTMNYFSRWPKDALCAVSKHFLKNYNFVCTEEIKEEIINVTGEVQEFVIDACTEYFNR